MNECLIRSAPLAAKVAFELLTIAARGRRRREHHPRYAMVAHITLKQFNALHGSRFRRTVPDTWHLAKIVRDEVPSRAPVFDGPTVKDDARLNSATSRRLDEVKGGVAGSAP
jgi:hypothetical protein